MVRKLRYGIAAVVLLVLAVLLPPFVNLNQFKQRIAGHISRAVGRDVTVGGVSLRLLPEPGVTLENFVVKEDPRFGAEPIIRANEVVATLRLTSMWRGRIEIGKLSLKEPSLNMVRAEDGHWNIEALLVRAAQTPTAPTAKPRPETRTRFPYIEAEAGRINFKVGQEKKVWTLTDADFALWLASEDEWRTRLVARPVRTDATLSDTGTLRVNGSLQRTPQVNQTLLKFHVTLDDAQLGQVTTLVYGHDRGWRGTTAFTVDVSGTPDHLALIADASVDQFRRYDITPADSLRLSAHCVSQYWAQQARLSDIECHLPTDNGDVSARGSISKDADKFNYDLSVTARDVPMSYAVAFVRRAKRDLPVDLTAEGLMNAVFAFKNSGESEVWEGGGATRDFLLRSKLLETPLTLGEIKFAIQPVSAPTRRARLPHASPPSVAPSQYEVVLPQFVVPLGSSQPATVQGTFTGDGYSVQVAGTASLSRLLQVALSIGVPAPGSPVEGVATHMALQIAGQWRGFPQPLVTGTSDIQNARFQIAGVSAPVQVSAASIGLQPSQVQVQNISGAVGPIAIAGSLHQSRGCSPTMPCTVDFNLRADKVSLDDINLLVNPRLRSEPWYRLFGNTPPTPLFTRLHATGQIAIAKLALKSVTMQNVTGGIKLDPGSVELSNAMATLFGGTIRGNWTADLRGADPIYAGSGTVEHIALAQVATAMRDNWATGTVDGTYRFGASGWGSADVSQTAAASLDFDWKDGTWRHLTFAPAQLRTTAATNSNATGVALRIRRFQGRAVLKNGAITLENGHMDTPEGVYAVSGTASRNRELALKFSLDPSREFAVGGTLQAPQVEAVALPTRGSIPK